MRKYLFYFFFLNLKTTIILKIEINNNIMRLNSTLKINAVVKENLDSFRNKFQLHSETNSAVINLLIEFGCEVLDKIKPFNLKNRSHQYLNISKDTKLKLKN